MEDDAKNYIFKDCLISEALRSNTHSPGLPSNGLYYDVVGSSSNTNLSYFQGSLDLNLDYSSPPSRVHNYLVADQTSSTPKSRNLVDTNAFFDLNDYQPIFDSSPDIEIDGDSVDHRKLFIESTDVSTIATTTVEPNPQNRRIPSSDENRSRFPNRCREIFIHSRDDNKIFDTKPLISRSDEEEVVITDDGQYFAGEYILANNSSSLSASQNGPFVTDDVVVVTADQSNSGSSIYDEPCLTSSSSASLNDGEELWSAAGDDYSSSSPTPAPPPLSYICTVRTEKNSNHHFNLSKFAFNNVNGSYDSSLLLTSVSALNKHRSKMQDLALRHRLITNQNVKGCGQLILSAEERRTLVQEGYSIPKTLPLTKKEEEALKMVRRKIKNKLSAQESRRRRKEYIDTLERKLRHCQTENDNLCSRLEALEKNNADLVNEVKTLKGDTINDNRSSTAVIVDRHRQQVQSAQGPHSGGVTLTALFLLFAVLIPSIPVWSGLNFFGCMIRFPATLDNGSGSILFDGERYSPIRSQIFDESTTRVEHDLEMEKPLTTTTNSHSRLLQSDYSDTNEYHDFAFAAQFLGQFKTICPVEVTAKKSDEVFDLDFSASIDKDNNLSSRNDENLVNNLPHMKVNFIKNDLVLVQS